MIDLRLARWYDVLTSLQEAIAEENDERWRQAAFVGWQFGAGGKKTFGEYLRAMGLGYRDELLHIQQTGLVSKEEAMANAERVLEYFRAHPKIVRGRSAQIAGQERKRAIRRARR